MEVIKVSAGYFDWLNEDETNIKSKIYFTAQINEISIKSEPVLELD